MRWTSVQVTFRDPGLPLRTGWIITSAEATDDVPNFCNARLPNGDSMVFGLVVQDKWSVAYLQRLPESCSDVMKLKGVQAKEGPEERVSRRTPPHWLRSGIWL